MAKSKVRFKIHDPAIVELMTSPQAHELVNGKAEQLAEMCNAQSSWGGYDWAPGVSAIRARARVWSFDNRADENRRQRMLRNLSSIT